MIGKIKERGITLIALVVTIIILLILAGVTLNIALSENGLLGKAKESAESYKTAQQNEIDELTRLEKQLGTPPTTIQEVEVFCKELDIKENEFAEFFLHKKLH